MTLEALLQPEALDELLLQAYGARWVSDYRPVLASQWSKYYFMCLWGRTLSVGFGDGTMWDSIRIVVGNRGLPESVEWQKGGSDLAFDDVVEQHLRPLIKRFARLADVPAAVLWSNAGDALEQVFRGLLDMSPLPAVLTRRQLAGGSPNPLYGTVHYLADGTRKVRACCLAYRVPGIGHCQHCPLQN
ncbi:siderophore-iron reductase FhuF [Pseudomonas sp. dw_358]|uniref:siderophore-iron reductase FhuF n=1 Tax=Pseudomonas sp. dw_358 TaxID=2720083 RepID=UPI001BD5C60B|nr:siderophore-iron reductase FhuF [Pseudomonas sp. dw_358]